MPRTVYPFTFKEFLGVSWLTSDWRPVRALRGVPAVENGYRRCWTRRSSLLREAPSRHERMSGIGDRGWDAEKPLMGLPGACTPMAGVNQSKSFRSATANVCSRQKLTMDRSNADGQEDA